MNSNSAPNPTGRELQILSILWELNEGTVREIYERLRGKGESLAQNTVQAFLRIMTDKGLVTFREQGRAFVYKAAETSTETRTNLVRTLLNQAFCGALDALVQSAFDARKPTQAELDKLEAMIRAYRGNTHPQHKKK